MTIDQIRKRSYKEISTLEPVFAGRVIAWYEGCLSRGIIVMIYCGARFLKEQARLYAIGRTTPGEIVTNAKPKESFHNYRIAVDYVPMYFRNEKVGWECDWDNEAQYLKAKETISEFNLRPISWEMPHLEDGRYKNWRKIPKELLVSW